MISVPLEARELGIISMCASLIPVKPEQSIEQGR